MNDLRNHIFAELAGSADARLLPPLVAGGEEFSDGWLHRMRKTNGPLIHPIRTYLLSDLTVSGRGHLTFKGELLCSSSFMPKYWHTIVRNNPSIVENELSLPERVVNEPCIVFMGHGSQVYGHFVVEMLPRLEVARQSMATLNFEGFKYLVNDYASPWLKKMLSELGIPKDQIILYYPLKEKILLRQAIVPVFLYHTDDGFHPYAEDIFNSVSERLCVRPDACTQNRRIFISRGKFAEQSQQPRRLQGEIEISDIAKNEFGFDVVFPEDFSLREQVEIFQSARLIVGEAGSALHNAVFSPVGTVIGSIGFRNMLQWQIGGLRQHANAFLKCDVREDVNRRGQTLFVEPDVFRRWLQEVCAASTD